MSTVKRLLMTDLDGTLLDGEKNISKENKAAIYRFVEEGNLFCIATGRTELTCRLASDELPVNAPIVLYNGAAIYDLSQEAFLWKNTFRGECFLPLLERLLASFPKLCVQVFAGGPLMLVNPEGEEDPYIVREGQPTVEATLSDIKTDLFKIMFRGEHALLEQVNEQVESWKRESNVAFDLFFSADYYLEIVPVGCSKGACLKRICDIVGLPVKDMLAIGDHLNDVDMLRVAGISAAPMNAIEQAKQSATYIVRDCNHSAIADFIEKAK